LGYEGFADEIKTGFIYGLLSSPSPMHGLINPNLHDQRMTMESQFTGMSNEAFSYEEFEATRMELLNTVLMALTAEDKEFLLSIKGLKPNWSRYQFQDFPAVRWKIQNLETLRADNPKKYQQQYDELSFKLGV